MENSANYVLTADIGGTNTRLDCFKIEAGRVPVYLMGAVFSSKGNRLIEQVTQVLSLAHEQFNVRITRACFAVAGVINEAGDHADFANLDWNLDCKPLIEATSLEKIILLNDFEALGFGTNFLDENNEKDMIFLPHPDGSYPAGRVGKTRAIIGAGTGLGHGILVYNEEKKIYLPVHSEGSHVDLAACSQLEWDLIEYLQKNVCPHPHYETVASGPGLVNIYRFLCSRKKNPSPANKVIEAAIDKAAAITENVNRDETCKEAFGMFLEFYARAAKNLALMSMSTGGMYLGGGITPKILPLIQKSSFAGDFEKTGSVFHIEVLKNIPLRVILNPRTALIGAAVWGGMAD